jgi:hypothetical protein
MNNLMLKAHEVVRFPTKMAAKELRNIVKKETGFSVRRLDNVTLLALSAVDQLMKNNDTCKHLALYSGAEYMSIELFQSVILAMENNEAVRPYDFIATVGNAANFYLTKEFNIKGPNVFIGSSKNTLLKSGLLASVDLNSGHCQQAVIVIWQLDNEQQRCHALLVEKTVDIENNIQEWHSKLTNSDELLTLATKKDYPILLNLTLERS